MPEPDTTITIPDCMRREAAASKARVRKRLNAMLYAQLQHKPAKDVLDDMPWQDPSHSGEFEAVLS